MTQLSLSAINREAPYQLRVSPLGGFDFDIDAGLTYNIALIEDYTFGDNFETYMLNVLPHSMEEYNDLKREKMVRVRRDDKIKPTVMAVLREAMKDERIIVDYVCLTEDNRQEYRFRLFQKWFDETANPDEYTLLTTSLKVEKTVNYFGAFLRKDNIQYDEFCEAFRQFDKDIHKDEPWNMVVREG